MDDESRDNFITLLRHPPCEIPFSLRVIHSVVRCCHDFYGEVVI